MRTLSFRLLFAMTLVGGFVAGAGRWAFAAATGQSFPAGTEFFVLSQSKTDQGGWRLFVTPAKEPTSGYWLSVRPDDRRYALLAADEDLLAYDVTHPAKARYLRAKAPVTGARRDDLRFAKLTKDPHWHERYFRRLEDNIPMTGTQVAEKAGDSKQVCPAHPQAKNGQPCEGAQAKRLPPSLIEMIKRSAHNNKIPPALLAALIQTESEFDFWRENTQARDACAKDHDKCSKYKWERGLGQLGKKVSEDAGILWDVSVGKIGECKKDGLSDRCVHALEEACKGYRGKKPYDCPGVAVEAAAKKLASTRAHQADTSVHPASLAMHLQPSEGGLEAWRNVVGAYNRGPRVANAYAEFNRQHGRYPRSYGEAWSVERRDETPSSKGIGYYLLHKEYINRCYVYRIVGICGELPKESLAKQFEVQVGSELLESPRSRPHLFRRALAHE